MPSARVPSSRPLPPQAGPTEISPEPGACKRSREEDDHDVPQPVSKRTKECSQDPAEDDIAVALRHVVDGLGFNPKDIPYIDWKNREVGRCLADYQPSSIANPDPSKPFRTLAFAVLPVESTDESTGRVIPGTGVLKAIGIPPEECNAVHTFIMTAAGIPGKGANAQDPVIRSLCVQLETQKKMKEEFRRKLEIKQKRVATSSLLNFARTKAMGSSAQDRINELEGQLHDRDNDLHAARQAAESLKGDCEEKDNELRVARESAENLKRECEKKDKKIQLLEAQLKSTPSVGKPTWEKNMELQAAEDEIVRLKKDNSDLVKALDDNKARVQASTKSLAQATDMVEHLSRQYEEGAKWYNKAMACEEDMKEAKRRCETAMKVAHDLRHELRDKAYMCAALQAQLDQNSANDKVSKLEAEVAQYQQHINNLSAEYTAASNGLADEVTRLNDLVVRQDTEGRSLLAQLSACHAELEQAKNVMASRISEKESELGTLRVETAAHTQALENAKEELANAELAFEIQTAELGNLRANMAVHTHSHTEAADEMLGVTNQAHEEQAKELAACKQNLTIYKRALEMATNAQQEAASKLKETKTKLKKANKKAMAAANSNAQTEVEQLRKKNDELAAQLKDLEALSTEPQRVAQEFQKWREAATAEYKALDNNYSQGIVKWNELVARYGKLRQKYDEHRDTYELFKELAHKDIDRLEEQLKRKNEELEKCRNRLVENKDLGAGTGPCHCVGTYTSFVSAVQPNMRAPEDVSVPSSEFEDKDKNLSRVHLLEKEHLRSERAVWTSAKMLGEALNRAIAQDKMIELQNHKLAEQTRETEQWKTRAHYLGYQERDLPDILSETPTNTTIEWARQAHNEKFAARQVVPTRPLFAAPPTPPTTPSPGIQLPSPTPVPELLPIPYIPSPRLDRHELTAALNELADHAADKNTNPFFDIREFVLRTTEGDFPIRLRDTTECRILCNNIEANLQEKERQCAHELETQLKLAAPCHF